MKRISLILSFILFIALCASLSFWLLQLMKPEVRHVVAPTQVKPVADVASVAGLFGGAATVSTNYQLKGIIVANPASQSGAILAVDSQPAQAFRLMAEIRPGVVLGEVHPDFIILSDQGVNRRINLLKESKAIGLLDKPSSRYPNVSPAAAAAAARIPDLNQSNRNVRGRDMASPGLDPSRAYSPTMGQPVPVPRSDN